MKRKRPFKRHPKPGRTPNGPPTMDSKVFSHFMAGLLGYGLARLGMPPEDAFAFSNRMIAKATVENLKAERDEEETDFLLGLS